MYLHIGNDFIIYTKEIVGIFDLDKTSLSKKTKEFLKISEEEGFINDAVGNEIPKSFIITDTPVGNRVYLSPISVATLKKRIESKYISI